MSIKYIINWKSNKINQIIDVRSPDEYSEDHIPNSLNIPVLNNNERKLIGTIYKNENPFKAKKLGASLISKNIANFIRNKLINTPGNWKPLIYCWRGGQRSKSLAITLAEIGWEVYVLKGGYKTYRKYINTYLNQIIDKNKYIVLRGPTGNAKTKIIEKLEQVGSPVLNLEKLANHKGSLLGKDHTKPQPSQKLFESLLYYKLKNFNKNKPILIESESSKIGNLFLPSGLVTRIENSPCIDIYTSLNARIEFLLKDYSKFILKKNSFKELFLYAQIKLGSKAVNKWKNNYYKKKWKNLASQIINEYYDPLYNYKKKQKKNKVLEQYKLENLKRNSIAKFCFYLHKKYF